MRLIRLVLAATALLVPISAQAQKAAPALFDPSIVVTNLATGAIGVAPASPTQIGGVRVSTGLQADPQGNVSVMYGRGVGTALQGSDPAVGLALSALQPMQTAAPSILMANGVAVSLGNLTISQGALLAPVSQGSIYTASGGGLTLNAGVFSLAFQGGVTAPAALPKVVATGAYSDLAGLPSLGTAAAQAATAFDPAGAATNATAGLAPLVSPALTGAPTAPTPTAGDNTTKVATTGFVTPLVTAETTRATSAEAQATQKANNLSDLTSASAARINLGLGTAATSPATAFDPAGAATNATAGLAPLASPALTGAPTAPTPTAGDNTTKVATTGFVTPLVTAETTRATSAEAQATQKANNLSDLTSASAARINLGLGTAATSPATAFDPAGAATNATAGLAPLASPALTGAPTAPTPTAGDNTTKVATTGFVTPLVTAETTRATSAEAQATQKANNLSDLTSASAARINLGLGTAATSPATAFDPAGAATNATAGLAPLASPALTGAPTAPTPTAGDNTTKVATTGFVTPLVTAETTRAQTAEGALAPKTAMFAGLQLGSAPTPQQVAQAINAIVLDQYGTLGSQKLSPPGAPVLRTLAARAADVINVIDMGANPNHGIVPIGTAYGASVPAAAAYVAPDGTTGTLAWLMDQNFGLNFSMTSSVSGTEPTFVEQFSGNFPAYSENSAIWVDPEHHNLRPRPGYQVVQTSGANCLQANTVIAPNTIPTAGNAPSAYPHQWGIAQVPVRQGELLPAIAAPVAWAPGVQVLPGQYTLSGGNLYQAILGGVTGTTAPTGTVAYGAGQLANDGGVQWAYIQAGGFPAPVAWTTGVMYSLGTYVTSSGNTYVAAAYLGSSHNAGGTAPSGTNTVSDGNIYWGYVGAGTQPAGLGAETDWAPNTVYPPHARVATNGAHWTTVGGGTSGAGFTIPAYPASVFPTPYVYGGPVYPASWGGQWTSAYLGTNNLPPADGNSITWMLVGKAEYRMLPTGVINVTPAPSATCPQNALFQFTMAPAQFQGLSQDWFGIQDGVAQAYKRLQAGVTGVQVHLPGADYYVNQEILNPNEVYNINTGNGTMDFAGDGKDTSTIHLSVTWGSSPSPTSNADLGTDTAVILETVNGDVSPVSNTRYHGFTVEVDGNPVDQDAAHVEPLGASAVMVDGIACGEKCHIESVAARGVHFGVNWRGDHQTMQDFSANGSYCGLGEGDGTRVMGNQLIAHSGLGNGYGAAICVSQTNQLDSMSVIGQVGIGFAPYAMYGEPPMPNVVQTGPNPTTWSNTTHIDVPCEQVGEECWRTSLSIGMLRVLGSGQPNPGQYARQISDGFGGRVPANAVYQAGAFQGNWFQVSTMGGDFTAVTKSLIYVSGDCSGNHYLDDASLIFGISGNPNQPTAPVPAIKCATDGTNGNQTLSYWENATNSGTFSQSGDGYFTPQGEPVSLYAANGASIVPYQDGATLFGWAGANCNPDGLTLCPVIQKGIVYNVPNFSGQTVHDGDRVYATSIGGSFNLFAGLTTGFGPGASGVMQSDCAAGARCTILLVSGITSGSPGTASVVPTGNTAATAVPLTAINNQISGTPAAGSGVILPTAFPVGGCIRVSNPSSVAVTEYPPAGSTIDIGQASTTIPAASNNKASGTNYCKTSPTNWQ